MGAAPWGRTRDGTPVDPSGIADNPPALGPAGTVHASLPDYARFVRLFLGDSKGVLTTESIGRLTVSVSDPEKRTWPKQVDTEMAALVRAHREKLAAEKKRSSEVA